MIRRAFTIIVEIDEACEAATGGINNRHLAAAFNQAEDEDNGEAPLGQIVWAPEFKYDQPSLEETGWYIVGVLEAT